MFKRKLIRAGFLSYSLLIINIGNTQTEIAAVTTNTVTSESSFSNQPSYFPADSLLNNSAVKFVNAYLKKNGFGLTKLEKRNRSSFKIISSILAKNNIPVELKYLAVVESGLKPNLVN